jgi:hypothetical protein
MLLVSLLDWPHKSNKFVRNNPVEISVFNSLVVLILLDIKLLEVIPVMLDCKLQALETVEHSALVKAFTLGSISKWLKKVSVALELLKSLLGGHFQNNYHEGSHQEA